MSDLGDNPLGGLLREVKKNKNYPFPSEERRPFSATATFFRLWVRDIILRGIS